MSASPAANRTNSAAASANAVTDLSGRIFVCPVIGQLDLSGSAMLTTLEQVTVTVPYDDKYSIELDAQHSFSLASAFKLDGSGSSFTVAWSDASGTQFATEMKYIIDTATLTSTGTGGNVDSTGVTLSKALDDDVRATFKDIFADGIPNILESDWDISSNVASQAAADDMKKKLTVGPRELIAQQLPESNYIYWMDGSENALNKNLPVMNGDTLVFVFAVNQVVISRLPKKTAGLTADDNDSNTLSAGTVTAPNVTVGPIAAGGTSVDGTGPYGDAAKIQYTFNNRNVAFYVKFSGLSK
jgi:hypothetical protein